MRFLVAVIIFVSLASGISLAFWRTYEYSPPGKSPRGKEKVSGVKGTVPLFPPSTQEIDGQMQGDEPSRARFPGKGDEGGEMGEGHENHHYGGKSG
jgi:hypothetical protein